MLRDNATSGAARAAEILKRSVKSVRMQASRQRVSLRRPGCRRGPVLGQPRAVSWMADAASRAMRENVLAGVFDVARAESLIRDELAGRALLCPACAVRPQTNVRTGLCAVCHAKMLAERHREAIAVLAARRDVVRLRQEKKRLRQAMAAAPAENRCALDAGSCIDPAPREGAQTPPAAANAL